MSIGCDLGGKRPARARIGGLRVGSALSSYSYDTPDLSDVPGGAPGRHVEVDEVTRLFDRFGLAGGASNPGCAGAARRDTEPRATTGALLFAPLDSEGGGAVHIVDTPVNLARQNAGVPALRSHGLESEATESAAISFAITSGDCTSTDAWLDNASLEVSNVEWEFNVDGGDGRWYPLHDIPNRAYARVNLPRQTNHVTVRAVSSTPDEWVQGLAVTPLPDRTQAPYRPISWDDGTGSPKVDGFGRLTWTPADGGYGTPVYRVYRVGLSDAPKSPYLSHRGEQPVGRWMFDDMYHEDEHRQNELWALDPRVVPCFLVGSKDEDVPKSPCVRVVIGDADATTDGYFLWYDDSHKGPMYDDSWALDPRTIPCYSVSDMDEDVPTEPCLVACGDHLWWRDPEDGSGLPASKDWTHDERSMQFADAVSMFVPFGGELVLETRCLHADLPGYPLPMGEFPNNLVLRDAKSALHVDGEARGSLSLSVAKGPSGSYWDVAASDGDMPGAEVVDGGKNAPAASIGQPIPEKGEYYLFEGMDVECASLEVTRADGTRDHYPVTKAGCRVAITGTDARMRLVVPFGAKAGRSMPCLVRGSSRVEATGDGKQSAPHYYVVAVDVRGNWVSTEAVA